MDRPVGDVTVPDKIQDPPTRGHPQSPPPGRRRRGLLLLLVLLVLLVLGVLGWRLLHPTGGGRKPAEAASPVGVASVTAGDMEVVLTGLGTVTPLATITVQTQISGLLMSVGYKEGQIVRQGDFLAQIDPRPYEVTLQTAQGAFAHDSGLLAQARSDLARYLVLAKRNSIAQQTVTDQQFLVQQDEGLVIEDQASINSAKLNLTYCHITAPVTGRLGLRLVDPGNYVQTASATGLVVETQLQPISVVFVLPEDDIPDLAQAMQAGAMQNGAKLEVDAYDRSNNTRLAQGSLITVDNTVDTTTGAVKLRASFPNTDNALFPNQFVNARLLLKTLHQVTTAPQAAVQQGAPGSFVYLLRPDSSVAVQVVHTGVTDADSVQILSGLKPGDRVVVDGVDRLRDGAKVRVAPPGGAKSGTHQATVNNGPGAAPGQQSP